MVGCRTAKKSSKKRGWGHACNPSARDADTRGWGVLDQPQELRATMALHETPSQNQKQNQQAKVEKSIKTCVFMAWEKYISYNWFWKLLGNYTSLLTVVNSIEWGRCQYLGVRCVHCSIPVSHDVIASWKDIDFPRFTDNETEAVKLKTSLLYGELSALCSPRRARDGRVLRALIALAENLESVPRLTGHNSCGRGSVTLFRPPRATGMCRTYRHLGKHPYA